MRALLQLKCNLKPPPGGGIRGAGRYLREGGAVEIVAKTASVVAFLVADVGDAFGGGGDCACRDGHPGQHRVVATAR